MEQLVHSPKSLASAITRQRKAKKLSQTEAGSIFNIEQSTFSSIENGAPGTRLETLFRILAALDLEMVIRPKTVSTHKTEESW
ncbi:MAG: XRE family transcriptional regulator [Gammaproteobacteria bacterium]|nr:XRE family transcriptional regulator [Gammaproteobacteria bacterium]